MAKIIDKNIFLTTGSVARRWGQDYGNVRDIFKLFKRDGDYLVRFGDATIEKENTIFTKYENKKRYHLVLDPGACDYTGIFRKYQKSGFDFFDFNGNFEINCFCHRPSENQRVLNVITDPSIEIQVYKKSIDGPWSCEINSNNKWQIDFFYFDFNNNLSVNCLIGDDNFKIDPYSTLFIDASNLEKKMNFNLNLNLNFLINNKIKENSFCHIYHFRLTSEKEEYYET